MTVDATPDGDTVPSRPQAEAGGGAVDDRDNPDKRDEGPDWKSFVSRRKDAPPDFPTVSKFQKGDTVWVVYSTARGVLGPCTIVEVLDNETYRLRDMAARQEWTESGDNMRYHA